MKNQIAALIADVLKDLDVPGITPEVTVPEDSGHGDYTTNVAMILAKTLKKPPMEIALQVKEAITRQLSLVSHKKPIQNIHKGSQKASQKSTSLYILQAIDRVDVTPPGFLNIFLIEASLISQLQQVLKAKEAYGTSQIKVGEGIMVEYGDPNTHKAFHIGHLRNITIGESVARLLEAAGAEVIHTSYQGDVGMHIAKCLYALLNIEAIYHELDHVRTAHDKAKVDFLGGAYAAGSSKFDESEEVKKEVAGINKKIYAKDPQVYPLYQESRQWSLDYFEGVYTRVGTVYKRNYFEGEVYETGKHNVLEGLKKGIFEESEGAIIFPGEKFGLHNRVFITKEGNPTYEGKDMGLGPLQYHDLAKWTKHPVLVIRVVGPEQAGYFQVVFEAQSRLFPELRDKFYHLIAGWVKLKHGKMSSRSGNVVLGEWLLDEAKKAILKIVKKNASNYTESEQNKIAEKAAVAAVKYAFLKVGPTSEIAFDLKESVNFQGDSGPYLQYTYARARSVLRKSQISNPNDQKEGKDKNPHTTLDIEISDLRFDSYHLNPEERAVARLLTLFPDVVAEAGSRLSPSVLCTYLFKLAQSYNLFYAKHTILGGAEKPSAISHQPSAKAESGKLNAASSFRLALTAATAQILKTGLYLLGIETLEQM